MVLSRMEQKLVCSCLYLYSIVLNPIVGTLLPDMGEVLTILLLGDVLVASVGSKLISFMFWYHLGESLT